MSQTGLPPRLLDLAAFLKETVPATRWYLHILIRNEYTSSILGTFKTPDQAHDAFGKIVKLAGAISSSHLALNLLDANFGVPWMTMVASPQEDFRKLKIVAFSNYQTSKKISSDAPVPVTAFQKFKEAVKAAEPKSVAEVKDKLRF
jgi:hypothetical protein